MPYDPTNPLVIGSRSRAFFDPEKENRIYEEQGIRAEPASQYVPCAEGQNPMVN